MPPSFLRLDTPRLELIACDAELALAAANAAEGDRAVFSSLLDAEVSDEWPPELMADHLEEFAAKLAERPEQAGWWHWCVIAKPAPKGSPAKRTLVGAGGFSPPDDDGAAMIGYAVLPSWRRRGYATEAVGALLEWALSQPTVTSVRAATFPSLPESIRVMERNYMRFVGPGPDEGTVMYEAVRLDMERTL